MRRRRRGARRAKVDGIGRAMRDPAVGKEFRRRFGKARLWAAAERAFDELILHGACYDDLMALRDLAREQYGDLRGYLRLLIWLDSRRRERGERVGDVEDPIAEMRRYYTDAEVRLYLRRKYGYGRWRQVYAGEIAV